MDRVKHRRHKHTEAADLDVTPFMNLMIVLVPVLLLSMVFTHTTVIELNFPTGESAGDAFKSDAVHLEVVVRNDTIVVADGRGGTIKTIGRVDGEYDYAQLSLVMQELKRRMPEKEDITVLLEQETLDGRQEVVTALAIEPTRAQDEMGRRNPANGFFAHPLALSVQPKRLRRIGFEIGANARRRNPLAGSA